MGIDAEMFVRTRAPITEDFVRRLGYELGRSFGRDRFWISRAGQYDDQPHYRGAAAVVEKYEQDGDDIVPEPGETFIRIYPTTRYYGAGYERGDLPFLIMLAWWLESKVPGGAVWCGGDSSGVCAEPFGVKERADLWAHFLSNAHEPYNGFGRSEERIVCPDCVEPMVQYGSGGGWTMHVCDGCGWRRESQDGVVTQGEYAVMERARDARYAALRANAAAPKPAVDPQADALFRAYAKHRGWVVAEQPVNVGGGA